MDGVTQDQYAAAEAERAEETKAAEESAAIVQRAKECYQIGMSVSANWRKDALEDMKFLAGDQWDPNTKGMREQQKRPALTVNRLPQFVRQVTNEQRQSKPAVTVNPVDSASDPKTAEVLQGVIRNVEYTSNADAAYAAGGQAAAITGLGYWDVCAEYEDERSFEQKLTISRIKNSMSVTMDPGTKEVAGDDARWVIKSSDVSESEWKARFPGREMPTGSGWKGEGDSAANWVGKEGVRIHEYRWIQEEEDTLFDIPAGYFEDIPNGGPVLLSDLDQKLAALLEQASDVNRRQTTRRTARWAKIAGDEVIEQGELAGRYLQLVRVVGTELEIDGETIYEGVIRHAKDTQRMLNYFVSAEAEAIALTPKAPFMAAEGQVAGHEAAWKNANISAASLLQYKPQAIGGALIPPPQRIMAEANVSAITNARMQAADDLKAVTGIYDGQLGARSNETSGRAILARQNQGQTANFHFQDNLGMAIRYTGRILIDLIPKIYSGPRTLRIMGEDGKHEMVPVNGQRGEFRGEPHGQPNPATGEQNSIQLDAGRYDVAVSMGLSYQSRRQEAAAQMAELFRADPNLPRLVGDLYVKSLDIPGGDAIAERIQKSLPPGLQPPDEGKTPPPQVLAQKLQETEQQRQQLVQAVNELQDKLDNNAQDNASKERIEMTKLHVELVKTMATLESKEHVAVLAREAALIGKRLGMTGFAEPIEKQPQPQMMPPQPMQGG